MEQFDRITTDITRMNGEPCIRNLRLTVRRVLEALATYPDRAELKREYPELEDEDIRQVLAFAAALVGPNSSLESRSRTAKVPLDPGAQRVGQGILA